MSIKKSNIVIVLWLIVLSVIAILLLSENKKIVTLDAKKIINEMILNGSHPKEEDIGFIDEMSQCLGLVIEEYALEHKVMILPQQAALAGNQDITVEIEKKMHSHCAQHD